MVLDLLLDLRPLPKKNHSLVLLLCMSFFWDNSSAKTETEYKWGFRAEPLASDSLSSLYSRSCPCDGTKQRGEICLCRHIVRNREETNNSKVGFQGSNKDLSFKSKQSKMGSRARHTHTEGCALVRYWLSSGPAEVSQLLSSILRVIFALCCNPILRESCPHLGDSLSSQSFLFLGSSMGPAGLTMACFIHF